eukprot:scaffold362_cov304-Prasinococcus_capsulatus_cf.AAC.1
MPRWVEEVARNLACASSAHKPTAKYLQLATVRPDGTPANRTVVFRGFYRRRNPENKGELLPTSTLQFITDVRSEKIEQVGLRVRIIDEAVCVSACPRLAVSEGAAMHECYQIAKSDVAEACWYFLDTREQFRITGTLQVIAAAQAEQVRPLVDGLVRFAKPCKAMVTFQ